MADMTIDELIGMVRERMDSGSVFNATAKVVFDDGSILYIAGNSNSVSNQDGPADVTLYMSLATLNKLHRKETNATTAVMTGKIRIEGNLMLAMQLDKLLS
ncbi:MAG: SCP2 sterol-binding domain-containing protein [Blastocatellia bacterium]|jgi:putative sterol carrier protein